MHIRNTLTRYGLVTMIFHWVIAIIVIGQLSLGLYMADLPSSMQKVRFFGWHKEFGVLILMLIILRLIWRLFNITPLLSEKLPHWQAITARSVHWIFYVFLVILPLSGWMMTSAAGLSVSFFGLFVLPDLVRPNPQLRDWLIQIHSVLGFTLIGFVLG